MQDWLIPYAPTVAALAVSGLLLCLQLLVLDLAGIQAGHRPGAPITGNPSSFLFRAYRVHANTNESLAAFIALALAGLLIGADDSWLNTLCWIYVIARVAHMSFYYLGWQRPRSLAFGFSLGALFGVSGLILVSFLD